MAEETLTLIEVAVNDLMIAFDVTTPPVPVEIILQRPKAGMWKEINLSELSGAFIRVGQRYSPRMSIARLLVRYILRSEWGAQHGLLAIGQDEKSLHALSRAILIPRSMIASEAISYHPGVISTRFEIPEDDARLRLIEMGLTVTD